MFYDRLAEIAGEYVKNGHPVHIEDCHKTRKWQNKDGCDCYTPEIIAQQRLHELPHQENEQSKQANQHPSAVPSSKC